MPSFESILLEDWESTTYVSWQHVTVGARGMAMPSLLGEPLNPVRGASTKALHLVNRRTDLGSEVVGHHHLWVQDDATITFWARCGLSNPERLIFAVTGDISEDYRAAQARGRAWQGQVLLVQPTWTQFRIPMRELKPLGAGTVEPLRSGMTQSLHFVTFQETFDFWIDDIAIECSTPACQ